jgi:hypothetical protein
LCISSGKCAFPVLCVFVFLSPTWRQEDDHILFKKGNSCRLAHFRGFGADGREEIGLQFPPIVFYIFPSLLSCATPGLAALPFLCGLQQLLISRCGLQSCQ